MILNSFQRIAAASAIASAALLTGCRQDMHDQPKLYPQRGSAFYADGRGVRPQVENTIARSQTDTDSYMLTGMVGGKEGDGMPFPVNAELLQRGQERYNIYCSACHSRVGNGGGIIVQRGYRPAGNFHTDRLRSAPLGHFFNVMTNGYGAMPDYAAQVTPEDRWAIAAYIRALQLSQHATTADIKAGEKVEKLEDVAEREGLPRNFAAEWTLPATAVYGTPNNQDNGIPGEDMVNSHPAGPAPVAKPGPVTAEKPAPGSSNNVKLNAPGSTNR